MLIYCFLLAVSILIFVLRYTVVIKRALVLAILKRVNQIVVVFLCELALSIIIKRAFLAANTKIIALDNFRAYNILLFFSFFFDCIIGLVNALIRLVKAFLVAVLMIPRISYSLFGRLFEEWDDSFESYCGFLHIESSIT